MFKDLKVCTISKYPPYMSGHSFEALYQGRALFEMTGEKHFEVTYDASIYDKSSNYNNSPELMRLADKYVNVYRVLPDNKKNVKVFDGALIKAFTGQVINLVEEKRVNVISTFYLDPHAYIANEAKRYAKAVLGKKVVTAHKAVGSDVLNSIANHLYDGEGKFVLSQLLYGDLKFAVSQYTKDKLMEYSKEFLPDKHADKLNQELKILYAPFDNAYFEERDEKEQQDFVKKFKVNPDKKIISYFGRVFPEKGIDDLLEAFLIVKRSHPDTQLVIGGQGISLEFMKRQAQKKAIPDVIFTGGVSNSEKKALMHLSYMGVIPTKPVLNFVETLCICALEYLASGVPLVTTRVGGVPEAAGEKSLYAEHSDPKDLAEKISLVLEGKVDRKGMIEAGYRHVAEFNYAEITKKFVGYVEKVLD